jgi:hypothetical protein
MQKNNHAAPIREDSRSRSDSRNHAAAIFLLPGNPAPIREGGNLLAACNDLRITCNVDLKLSKYKESENPQSLDL